MKRRKFLMCGGASLVMSGCASRDEVWRWDGVVFGAPASVSLRGRTGGDLVEGWMALVRRYDEVFSLWREDSILSRLNREGLLDSAPQELVSLIKWSREFYQLSEGSFDPTVEGYLQWKREPDSRTENEVRETMGFEKVVLEGESVRLLGGAKINFNAVVQGWLTDEIVAYLTDEGVRSALVNTGEWRALGGPWEIEAAGETVSLTDRALAVSRVGGASIRGQGHLVVPNSAISLEKDLTVVVQAPTARLADGWATVAAVIGVENANAMAGPEVSFVAR